MTTQLEQNISQAYNRAFRHQPANIHSCTCGARRQIFKFRGVRYVLCANSDSFNPDTAPTL